MKKTEIRKLETVSKSICRCREPKTSTDCAYCGTGGTGIYICGVCKENGIDGPVIKGTSRVTCKLHKKSKQGNRKGITLESSRLFSRADNSMTQLFFAIEPLDSDSKHYRDDETIQDLLKTYLQDRQAYNEYRHNPPIVLLSMSHTIEASDYFQGYSSFSNEHNARVETGHGNTFREALEEALEEVYSSLSLVSEQTDKGERVFLFSPQETETAIENIQEQIIREYPECFDLRRKQFKTGKKIPNSAEDTYHYVGVKYYLPIENRR